MTMTAREQVFRQTLAVRMALALVFLFIIGMCLVVAFADREPVMGGVYAAVGFAVLYVLVAMAIGRTRIVLNPLSIRRETIFGTTEIPWERIVEYRYRILSNQLGAHGGAIAAAVTYAVEKKTGKAMSFLLTLKTDDKRKLVITANYRNAHELRDTVLSRIHPKMLEIARTRLARQEAVEFGPLVLRPDGIAYKKKDPVPLGELSKIELTSPQLRIKRTGKLFDAVAVGSQQIPNVIAFVELAREAAEKRTMRPMPAENFVVR